MPMHECRLKYRFDIKDLKHLKPGHTIASSCPPTNTFRNGRYVLFSPANFPLHFTLHLIYAKRIPINRGRPGHRFLLQLRLEQPKDIPCLPPFHILPTSFPNNHDDRCIPLDRRLIGPMQPATWGITWLDDQPVPGPYENTDIPWLAPSGTIGEFRFFLMDEPRELIAALPPLSKAQWSWLPNEMIAVVLRELPVADRVSARLVCRFWADILDTDYWVWSNVTHLHSISRKKIREEPYEYHDGRLNQVRDDKLYFALIFLTSRKAPIRTLELDQDYRDMYRSLRLRRLPMKLVSRQITLKALLFRAIDGWLEEDEKAESALVKLIKSQPSLERLHLELIAVPLPILLPSLPRLRILSLQMGELACLEAFQALPPPFLSSLAGLRFSNMHFFPEVGDFAEISRFVESQGKDLRRVESMEEPGRADTWPWNNCLWPCGCRHIGGDVLVWGTGDLSAAEAAFLLMPVHDTGYANASHYQI